MFILKFLAFVGMWFVASLNSVRSILFLLVYENRSANQLLSNLCEIGKTIIFSLSVCFFSPLSIVVCGSLFI
jgi:Na+/serine symporter